jgi:hypothetical protein
MATWHATLTYTLAVEPSGSERLATALRPHDGTAHLDARSLTIDLFVRSAHIASLQSAARLASYIARRAIFAAGLSVATEDGLSVVLAPALDGALAQPEPV